MLPNLPRELGGGPITTVSQGLSWAAIGLNQDPEPSSGRRPGQGRRRRPGPSTSWGRAFVQFLRQSPHVTPGGPDFAKLADDLKAEHQPETGSPSTIDAQKASKWATALLVPMRGPRGADAVREQPQADRPGDAQLPRRRTRRSRRPTRWTRPGKPLLSWRVLILPYLEQDALYKEFHLDEPWDSPHNKALIDRMPPTYRCPSMSRSARMSGKTTYLTPRGKATIFPGPEGVKIQKITDGTSNTIFVVDAADDRAVIWTKPDDWDVEPKLDLKGIFGHHPGGTNFGFADGSVRFIKETVDPKVMEKLLTRTGAR